MLGEQAACTPGGSPSQAEGSASAMTLMHKCVMEGKVAGNEFGEAGQGYISWTLVFLSILDFIISVLGSLWRVLKSTII